jgi:hypothetical protein
MSRQVIDLTGQRFGRLEVLSFVGTDQLGAIWRVRCDCGTEKTARAKTLRAGHAKSCGCYSREMRPIYGGMSKKHGMKDSPTYRVWTGMLGRCRNTKSKSYANYGGRGIAVCERWHAFEAFLADMGERPPGMTLERDDVNGDYEPGNCRWATWMEQARNKRNSRLIEYDGETLCFAEWVERTGLNRETVSDRLERGWSVAAAFSTPAGAKPTSTGEA